jgi:FixJ family two-component response regulator
MNIVSILGTRDMGWVMMSERELNRIEVLSQVVQGRMSAVTAHVLDLSRRQVHRLLKRFWG